jgi:hypothetical protein
MAETKGNQIACWASPPARNSLFGHVHNSAIKAFNTRIYERILRSFLCNLCLANKDLGALDEKNVHSLCASVLGIV